MFEYKNDGKTGSIKVRFPVMFLFTGWMLMLLMGILHIHVSPEVPLLGYWVCAAIMLVVELILWGIRGND